jgi:hypothetical protein
VDEPVVDARAVAVSTCRGCGAPLVRLHVAHFEAGRRSTTLELLCPTHGCEHHDRPDTSTTPATGASVPSQRDERRGDHRDAAPHAP